jgi:hypothetical protein
MPQTWFAGFFRRSRIGVLAAGAAVILVAGVVKTVDERAVNFVRPGLKITVSRADIATDGTLRVQFKVSDPQNVPLDREGITSPGVVSLSFVAAYIPKDGTQYTSYTVRTQTSPINSRSAIQASADTGGSYARIAEGEYTYTFGTRLPASADRSTTHSILIYGARNLTEFDFEPSPKPVTSSAPLLATSATPSLPSTAATAAPWKDASCAIPRKPSTPIPETPSTCPS